MQYLGLAAEEICGSEKVGKAIMEHFSRKNIFTL